MERIGLVDIGSNTIRLVIFEFDTKTGLNEILNIKTPARLSQYLTDDLKMNQDGIDVLTTTLHSFKSVANKFEVNELHPVATAAIRQSTNQKKSSNTLKANLTSTSKLFLIKRKLFMVLCHHSYYRCRRWCFYRYWWWVYRSHFIQR